MLRRCSPLRSVCFLTLLILVLVSFAAHSNGQCANNNNNTQAGHLDSDLWTYSLWIGDMVLTFIRHPSWNRKEKLCEPQSTSLTGEPIIVITPASTPLRESSLGERGDHSLTPQWGILAITGSAIFILCIFVIIALTIYRHCRTASQRRSNLDEEEDLDSGDTHYATLHRSADAQQLPVSGILLNGSHSSSINTKNPIVSSSFASASAAGITNSIPENGIPCSVDSAACVTENTTEGTASLPQWRVPQETYIAQDRELESIPSQEVRAAPEQGTLDLGNTANSIMLGTVSLLLEEDALQRSEYYPHYLTPRTTVRYGKPFCTSASPHTNLFDPRSQR